MGIHYTTLSLDVWLKLIIQKLESQTRGLQKVWGQPGLQNEIPSQTNKKLIGGVCVEVRGQLVGGWSSLPTMWVPGLNSGHEAWWQIPLTHLVTGTFTHLVCTCTSLYMYVWKHQKDKLVGVQPTVIPELEKQWGILRASQLARLAACQVLDSNERACLHD